MLPPLAVTDVVVVAVPPPQAARNAARLPYPAIFRTSRRVRSRSSGSSIVVPGRTIFSPLGSRERVIRLPPPRPATSRGTRWTGDRGSWGNDTYPPISVKGPGGGRPHRQPGACSTMPVPKVTFIGAGSAVFARQLMTDILAIDGLDEGVFALVDIDGSRLDLARRIADRLVELTDKRWKVEASTDRAEVLAGTDYVINSIEVAGLKNVRHDYDIPLRYGVDQCIGDTIGPGGIFKALRTGPAWLEIVADIERVAPHAVVMNYTNPMSILTLAALKATDLQVVGLCHSVQGTSRQVAENLDLPYEEMTWRCAGINHNAWFTTLNHYGEDLYPRLRERARNPEIYEQDPVRFEVMRRLGAFVTESSGHFSEYVPYFRKRPDLIQKYTRAGYLGESGFYANNWPRWRRANDELIASMLRGDAPIPRERGHEYGSFIVEAIEG